MNINDNFNFLVVEFELNVTNIVHHTGYFVIILSKFYIAWLF
jgi:hypothetical protein